MEERKNYDSTFCGSLPLHLINQVQPFGVLLIVEKGNLQILQVSENIESMAGVTAKEAIAHSLADYISKEQVEQINNKFSSGRPGKVPLRITFNSGNKAIDFLAIVQSNKDYLIFELEPVKDNSATELFIDVYQELKYAMAEIGIALTVAEVCKIGIAELKRILGFDKIMLYKFDEDWNGEVIAEVMEEGLNSYLGLRFPASDVPKQARELYFKSPYRLIPYRDYTPVKFYPVINPVTGSFIDLSNCNLRSVAAVHIEYLKNMDVMASMSTAIIKDEKLWGLISCHHKTEKYLSYELCSVFELIAGVISNRIHALENAENLHSSTELQEVQSKLMEQVYLDDNPVKALTDHPTTVLNLLGCEGAVVVYNKQFQTIGKVPGRYEIKDLLLWLQGQIINKLYSNNNLPQVYDSAALFAEVGSGIIVLPIHAEKGDYIIGFRPEVVQNVNWGGNPNEAINFEANNITYHPRNSFKLWKQTVQQTSLPWQKDMLQVAESFRNFLIEYTLKKVYSMM